MRAVPPKDSIKDLYDENSELGNKKRSVRTPPDGGAEYERLCSHGGIRAQYREKGCQPVCRERQESAGRPGTADFAKIGQKALDSTTETFRLNVSRSVENELIMPRGA